MKIIIVKHEYVIIITLLLLLVKVTRKFIK